MNWRKNLYIMCACNFFANIAFNMTGPFLPEILRVIGVQDKLSFWSGFLTSVTFLAYAIMSPIWGSLADRGGKCTMLLRSALGISLSYFFMAYAGSLSGLLVARLTNGLLSGYTPASIILLASCTPNYHVGYALGALNTFVAIGSILGPLVGGALIEILGVKKSLIAAGIIMILVALVSYYGTDEKQGGAAEKTPFLQNVKYMLNTPNILIPTLGLTILNMAVYMLQPILPLFITDLDVGYGQFMVGLVFSISAISLAMGSPIINRLHMSSKLKLSYIAILIGSMLLAGIFTLAQGLAVSVAFLIVQRFMFGFFQAGITVSSNVLIATHVQDEIRGGIFGMVTSFSAIGYIIGPFLGGVIGEGLGLRAAFFSTSALFLVTTVLLLLWQRSQPDLNNTD